MSLRVLVSAALFAVATGSMAMTASAAGSVLPGFVNPTLTQAGEFQTVRRPPRRPRKPRRPPRPATPPIP